MNQFSITIVRLGDESAAAEQYRRVVERDNIDPIIESLDQALKGSGRKKTRSDAGKSRKPKDATLKFD